MLSKALVMNTALDYGIATVELNPKSAGAVVPDAYRHQATLVLNFSRRFSPPDLVVDDEGIRSTLSFRGELIPVAVPWSAVIAIRSNPGGFGAAWVIADKPRAEEPVPPKKRPSHLRLVS